MSPSHRFRMLDPSLEHDLELARRAAHAAGELVMRHFRRLDGVRFKSPDQPVTDADLEADAALRRVLLGERPGYGWLSEETADSRARLECGRVWIVDPIDGTNSFVEGLPEFAVSVGLAERGEAVLGVVHNPATGETYHAARGAGAFRDDVAIRVAPPTAPGERGVMLASRTDLQRGELDAFRDAWTMLPLGSTAYRMVKVADGTGHLFASRGGRHEWDVCASAVIVGEAGGLVVQADGTAIRYNRPRPEVRGVIASNGTRVAPLLEAEPISHERTGEP